MQTTYSPAGQHPEQMNSMASSVPRHAYKPLGSAPGSQAPQSRPESRERSAYRLFPSGPVRQQLSPRTLQKETLDKAGSLHRRRSVSLDDSVRKHEETRHISSQRSNVSLRRKLGSVPDVQTTMSTVQERSQDPPTSSANTSYKSRVSEEGGHGRSASAPDDFVRHVPSKQIYHSRQPSRDHSISRLEPTNHGLGLTVQRKQSVKQQHRNLRLKIEKPLPPRPGSIIELSHQPNVTSKSNLSLPSQSAPQSAARQDSVTQMTGFHKSSVSASDNSYFPLSSDAKVRELMGLPPSASEPPRGRKPVPINTKAPATDSPSLTLSPPSSKFQKNFSPTDTSCYAETIDYAVHAQQCQPEQFQEDAPQALKFANPVLVELPQRSGASTPDMSMMPAGLRVALGIKSASTSRAPPPAMLEPQKSASASGPSTASFVDDKVSSAVATLAELAKQTETLYARHTGLRTERQKISSAIVKNLKENKPGPDYANSLLDQHMSLAAISSSMDICIAKLKSLECRKEEAIATLAASNKKSSCKPLKNDPVRSTESEPSTLTPNSSTAIISMPHPSPMPMSEILNLYSLPRDNPNNTLPSTDPRSKSASQLGSAVQQFTNEPPRRMNIKGAKAAKILGLVQEAENEQRPASPSITLPPLSATRSARPLTPIEADSKPPSPAPERPLPAPPSSRGYTPAPSPEPVRSRSRAVACKENGHDAYWNSRGSSRASSPEETEAQTPQEEGHGPRFSEVSKCNTNSMQTVHVYLSEPMLSSTQLSCVGEDRMSFVGEDDLLEYYRDLQ